MQFDRFVLRTKSGERAVDALLAMLPPECSDLRMMSTERAIMYSYHIENPSGLPKTLKVRWGMLGHNCNRIHTCKPRQPAYQ